MPGAPRFPSVKRLHIVCLVVPAVAIATLLAACGAASSSGAPTPATSGIDLLTMAGPTCPVQREGQQCEKPISARVVVSTTGGATVTTVQTGADGTAHVGLPPGDYRISAQQGGSVLPRPPYPTTVTVTAGSFSSVRLDYDTGIR